MVRKRGFPSLGELVVCKVNTVNPNSVFVRLEEYDKEGMVHISEVARGWIKDIRNHVKKDEVVIAKVLFIDEKKGHINLSLKRVDSSQANDKKKEYNMEQKAEKMLTLAAEKLGKTLDEAYKEVGYTLQENIGSIFKGFKAALTKPALLEKRGVPKEWIEPLRKVAEANIIQKEFEFRASANIESFEGDGILHIKKVLEQAQKSGLSVAYISAPHYMFKYKQKDPKKGEAEFEEKLKELSSFAQKQHVTVKVSE